MLLMIPTGIVATNQLPADRLSHSQTRPRNQDQWILTTSRRCRSGPLVNDVSRQDGEERPLVVAGHWDSEAQPFCGKYQACEGSVQPLRVHSCISMQGSDMAHVMPSTT
jgi:hypothetical protein